VWRKFYAQSNVPSADFSPINGLALGMLVLLIVVGILFGANLSI
jgi:hypothetical protein